MRITMINKHYPPHLGGIEYHLRDLSEALVERGQQVRALVASEEGERVDETLGGVDITRLPLQIKISSAPVAFGMRKEIQTLATETDVFHLHFPYPWGEMEWLRAKTGVPTVLTYHSDIVRQKAGLAAYRPMMERMLDQVDVIIASSPNMVEHSKYLAPRAHKCRVIPYGVHVERYADTPATVARAAELRAEHEGRKIILFVGRLVYYKGVDVLVRSLADVDADLVIVGRGPLDSKLREIAVANGSIDRISFLPPLPDDELVAWYHAADVFCLPSVARSEAFGLVQLEAHASGTPVVSTTLPTSVPFVNENDVTGLTVTPGSVSELAAALDLLVRNDALRARMGEQARERALRDFSTGRMVDDTLALYRQLVPGRGEVGGAALGLH